jgi:hypothetical protein
MVLIVCAVSLLALNGFAQELGAGPSVDSQIADLRAGLKAMEDYPPPPDSPDAAKHRRRYSEIVLRLQRLLLKKSGYLESRIQGLQTAASRVPEVQQEVDDAKQQLRSVESEIQNIDRYFAQNERPNLIVPPKPPEAENVNKDNGFTRDEVDAVKAKLKEESKLEERESERRATEHNLFNEKVAGISPEALKAAALPSEINSQPPACNERGRPAVVPYSKLDEALCRLGRDKAVLKVPFSLAREEANILTILIAKLLKTKTNGESYSSFVTEAQEIRTDQQMGAGPTSSSSTSLVSKGGVPYLFGFAVENGAAEQSQKDTSVTFRFNPAGVINMFANKGFITGFQQTENDPLLKALRKTSVGLTFDTSRGDTPGVFTGKRQQLSQVQARFEFVNERDPRHKRYLADWETLVADEGVKLAQQISKTTAALTNWADPQTDERDLTFKDPALQAWLLKTKEKIDEVDSGLSDAEEINAIARVISEQADQLPIKLVSEDSVNTITDFAAANKIYVEKKNELLDKIAKGRIYTLEYTNKREVNAPDTSNFNFIAATGAGSRIDLTANGSFTFFHTRPAATLAVPRPGRIRDFQFAGQVDIPFKQGFDFWFSGRYERLLEDATTLGGMTIPGSKGDIAVGQFGLNIPINSLGIKFPVSLTFANRTELVNEKEIRGNFGFTFNWDTLLSKLKPF